MRTVTAARRSAPRVGTRSCNERSRSARIPVVNTLIEEGALVPLDLQYTRRIPGTADGLHSSLTFAPPEDQVYAAVHPLRMRPPSRRRRKVSGDSVASDGSVDKEVLPWDSGGEPGAGHS